jgi:hypothetical protein
MLPNRRIDSTSCFLSTEVLIVDLIGVFYISLEFVSTSLLLIFMFINAESKHTLMTFLGSDMAPSALAYSRLFARMPEERCDSYVSTSIFTNYSEYS